MLYGMDKILLFRHLLRRVSGDVPWILLMLTPLLKNSGRDGLKVHLTPSLSLRDTKLAGSPRASGGSFAGAEGGVLHAAGSGRRST